jgi:hypothetical protein
MSTIVRRKRMSRTELGPYKRHELLFGEIIYPALGYTGYGDGTGKDLTAFISDEMRADWEGHRDELMAFWRSGQYTTAEVFPDSLPWLFDCGDGGLPWAAKQFDRKPRPRA